MGYLAVVMVMYTVVASLLEGMLPGPLEIGYHSSEPHVMAHNVIASLVLKLHEEKYIKFDDLASPAAEAAARKKADDMIEAYSSRPAVLEAQITKEWVTSLVGLSPAWGDWAIASGRTQLTALSWRRTSTLRQPSRRFFWTWPSSSHPSCPWSKGGQSPSLHLTPSSLYTPSIELMPWHHSLVRAFHRQQEGLSAISSTPLPRSLTTPKPRELPP